jgi:hypothetical protein
LYCKFTIKYNKDASTYAQHIPNAGHPYGNIQSTMKIIQLTHKGRHMDSLEKFHVYSMHQQNKQMNEVLFDLQNPIFTGARIFI